MRVVGARYYSTSTPGTGSSAQSSASVRDYGKPREPTAGASPTLAARKDAPAWHPTSRGAKKCASSVTDSLTSRDLALHDLHQDTNAHSASGPRASTFSKWVSFHHLWFGEQVPPFPLTTFKIYAIGAMFKAGGYWSGSNYLSRAKEEHVSRGFLWTDELRLAVRKTTSSITRGIGPSRQSLPLDLSSVWNEGPPWLSDTEGVPVGGKYLIIAGRFFCTREIVLSLALRRHISFDTDSKRVTWESSCSKTDPSAIGKFRSWDCVCGDDFGKPCACHALLLHCRRLDERFADRRHWEDLPLFPDPDGNTARKTDVVRLIEQAATRLGLATHSPQGSRLFGGHYLRVSGAQWLARSGVPLP